ncbi:MAG: RNA polymerase sigma factor WhiG [Candidatus Nanopelagicales bacterium]|jgi:RNA polymerase sigma factor for flagellar operon FliA|nr:RNA polymerase sigma factor WhiG [Candidatus Nanopelagicales bacterium]
MSEHTLAPDGFDGGDGEGEGGLSVVSPGAVDPRSELDPIDPDDAAAEMAPEGAALAALWADYKRTADARLREQLILQYAPLVRYVAGRVGVGLPANVEQGDLVSYGVFGLIDAIDKYDIGRAIKFETYAINRIRGAIIDELRSIDWIPRSVRTKARDVERAIAVLEARLQRTPSEAEIAEELGLHVSELRKVFSQVSFVHVAALDEMLASNDRADGATLGERLEDDRTDAPGDALDDEETRFFLARVIHTLPEREQIVVTLYYYEGLTLAEIGLVLGVTESRICQLHTKAMMAMRTRMSTVDED